MKKIFFSLILNCFFIISSCSNPSLTQTKSVTAVDPTNTLAPNPSATPTLDQAQLSELYGKGIYKTDRYYVFFGETDIILTDINGANPINLTSAIDGYASFITISPDNNWVIFDVTSDKARRYAGKVETTTSADVYIISTSDLSSQFLAHSTVNHGNDPTLWDEAGSIFYLNCPLENSITGLCQIKISENGATWTNLGLDASRLMKVGVNLAIAVDKKDCLYTFNTLDVSINQLHCAPEYNITDITPVDEKTILFVESSFDGTDTKGITIDFQNNEPITLFEFDGSLGYQLFNDRTKTQFAGCIEPEKSAQPFLFYYDLKSMRLYEFRDTDDIELVPTVEGRTFDCNRFYFLWNKNNELKVMGEIPEKPNSWNFSFSGSTLKCYQLNFENETITLLDTCKYNIDDFR